MFNLHGKKFFTFGGASSIDKEHRTEGRSWWAREIPSYAECEEGLSTLGKQNWETDFIITHTCSTKTLTWMAEKYGFMLKPVDAVNGYLDTVEEKLKYPTRNIRKVKVKAIFCFEGQVSLYIHSPLNGV